ncbi:MAG: hypothetical protein ACR2PK_12310 [Acidimicrobiales bacterium]
MPQRLPSLLEPPIAFADGGASAVELAGSGSAFALAIRLGATGIEAGAYLTTDDEVVVGADAVVRRGLRRKEVSSMRADEVTASHPRLADVVADDTVGFALSLAPISSDVLDAVVQDHSRLGLGQAGYPLWARCGRVDQLRDWRKRWPELRLVHDTTLGALEDGPERHAASLADSDIDAVRLPYPEWTGGLAALFHRFDVLAFGHTAIHDRMFDDLVRMGLDGISSIYVDRLVDAFARADLA